MSLAIAVRRALLIGAMVLCALPGTLGAKGTKGKKKAPAQPPQALLAGTLNEKRDDIQRCAITHALDKGANKVDVLTRITINGRGQVIDSQVTVTVVGADGEQVKSCVDQVVRAIKFPKTDAPLVHIERSWTVSAQ